MLNNKSLQTFLAIGPVVLLVLLIAGYLVFFVSVFSQIEALDKGAGQQFPSALIGGFVFFFVMILLTSLLSLFSLIYFIVHAAKNPNLKDGNALVVWIIVLVLINCLGPLIYWLAEIRMKNPKPVISD